MLGLPTRTGNQNTSTIVHDYMHTGTLKHIGKYVCMVVTCALRLRENSYIIQFTLYVNCAQECFRI